MEISRRRILKALEPDTEKMSYPGGWKKDRWAVTQPGNEKEFYAEHDNGVMLWYKPPSRQNGEYRVKAGTGTRIGDYESLTSEPNEAAAEATIQRAMALFPDDPEPRDMMFEL